MFPINSGIAIACTGVVRAKPLLCAKSRIHDESSGVSASKEDMAAAKPVTGPLADDPIQETITFDDYVRPNGEAGAKEAGRMRLEGKDYVLHDGDVMHFRFNV